MRAVEFKMNFSYEPQHVVGASYSKSPFVYSYLVSIVLSFSPALEGLTSVKINREAV
jgi:hypothetical protein